MYFAILCLSCKKTSFVENTLSASLTNTLDPQKITHFLPIYSGRKLYAWISGSKSRVIMSIVVGVVAIWQCYGKSKTSAGKIENNPTEMLDLVNFAKLFVITLYDPFQTSILCSFNGERSIGYLMDCYIITVCTMSWGLSYTKVWYSCPWEKWKNVPV